MRKSVCHAAWAFAVASMVASIGAQAPVAPAQGGAVTGVTTTTIVAPPNISIRLEVPVNRPAAEVWNRVGKFCDVGEWLQLPSPCALSSGRDGEVGAVRGGPEIFVGVSQLSYTLMLARSNAPIYHGTHEARPVTATTSKLYYTMMWDYSKMPNVLDSPAEKNRRAAYVAFLTRGLANQKILAEGGTLPPRSAAAAEELRRVSEAAAQEFPRVSPGSSR
jgi:hypothetical protein